MRTQKAGKEGDKEDVFLSSNALDEAACQSVSDVMLSLHENIRARPCGWGNCYVCGSGVLNALKCFIIFEAKERRRI